MHTSIPARQKGVLKSVIIKVNGTLESLLDALQLPLTVQQILFDRKYLSVITVVTSVKYKTI